MRIESIEINGLFGKSDPIRMNFHNDLNIITGKNGAGKTTILKLIWYIMSGNVSTALSEISFTKINFKCDLYELTIHKVNEVTCRGELLLDGDVIEFEDVRDDEEDVFSDARDQINEAIIEHGKSLFFPTFRRIEGGFSIGGKRHSRSFNALRTRGGLQEEILKISRELSNGEHTFVTSVSTVDIVELLLRQYTEMSERASSLQQQMSLDVIERIKDFKQESGGSNQNLDSTEAIEVLDGIRSMIEDVESKREDIMKPLQAVQDLGTRLFEHAGIKMNNRVSFGDAANAINSDALSAGEKQMLSFICYNAFSNNSVVFIDEPELSLHVDWQRLLFPTLLKQKQTNQFIIATHSPFIYSKYPDKEVMLSSSRGNDMEEDFR